MDDQNNIRKIEIPPPQRNYEISFGIARDKLAACDDFEERARKAGALWLPTDKVVELDMLGRKLRVVTNDIDVVDPGGEVELWEKIVAMHYLLTANGAGPTGKLISYKEIPDARLYWPNFIARVHKPLLAGFASKPQMLTEIAAPFGGKPHDRGDVSVLIPALPRVDIIYILWKGDEEFEPEAGCVFDENITDYLPAEDVTVLASMTAIKMMKIAFSKGG